jgi:hypothetical protein
MPPFCLLLIFTSINAAVTRYRTGSSAGVNPPLSGPAYDFGRGSTDVEPAIQWMIVIVNKNGLARVVGNGPVYFVLADHIPEKCAKKQPLTFSNFKIWKILSNETLDLKNRSTSSYYKRSVTMGKIISDPN